MIRLILPYSVLRFTLPNDNTKKILIHLSLQGLQFLNNSIQESSYLPNLNWYCTKTVGQVICCAHNKWHLPVNYLLCCPKPFIEDLIRNLGAKCGVLMNIIHVNLSYGIILLDTKCSLSAIYHISPLRFLVFWSD